MDFIASKKLLRSGMKKIGKSLEAYMTVYPKWSCETLLELLIALLNSDCFELTMQKAQPPEGAVTFEDVASRLNVQLVKSGDRCRRASIHQRLNVTTTQPSVITAQASSKKILRTQKDLKLNRKL